MELQMKKEERMSRSSRVLVPASRLELLRLVATTPSRWRVYQFHHAGKAEIKGCHRRGRPSILDLDIAGTHFAGGWEAGAEAAGFAPPTFSMTERWLLTMKTSMRRLVAMKMPASQ